MAEYLPSMYETLCEPQLVECFLACMKPCVALVLVYMYETLI